MAAWVNDEIFRFAMDWCSNRYSMRRVIVEGQWWLINDHPTPSRNTRSQEVNKIYNEPNNFRTGLAAPESNDGARYIHRVVTHASLCQSAKGSEKDPERERKPTDCSRQNASWLPVTERAGSTIIARRALVLQVLSSWLVLELQRFQKGWFTFYPIHTYASQLYQAYPNHLSCSLVANSSKTSKRWSRVIRRCFSDPCSKT